MRAVLITGGSGFLASHCLVQALQAGYTVHTTVRSLKREAEVRAMVRAGGVEAGERLRFFVADLEQDAGWAAAVEGCTYVLHVASPFPAGAPRHEDELIVPAREGALRVLRAAREAGVRRVVLTSSFAAVGYGHGGRRQPFTEADWTNLEGRDVSAYVKSKTLAERAAWQYVAAEGVGLELTVINPVGIFGPVLGKDYSASIQIVQRMLSGAMPFCPRVSFTVVDVRDAAQLHLLAMTAPEAAGERFLAAAGEPVTLLQIARLLRGHLGAEARRVPRFQMPDVLLRLLALVQPGLKGLLPGLGLRRLVANEKACRVLGWRPRGNNEALVATAESLLALGGTWKGEK